MPVPTPQARYWLLTIPQHLFTPFLPNGVCYIKGQLEQGENTGYLHWQVLACFHKKVRRLGVKALFGEQVHCEASRSSAANEYVWKEETSVPNTRFELGKLPFNRAKETDWIKVKEAAKEGKLDTEEVPADVFVRCYSQLSRISKDYMRPQAIEREVYVYWGSTGVGKSHKAWSEAGYDAYPKDPCTKFWDGYQGQCHVVIDEYRGQISISHMLRWLDKYPVCIETKGSGCVLKATKIWITSNLDPREWYPDCDEETKNALMRRLRVTHMLDRNLQ